jgi:hypothetical protein
MGDEQPSSSIDMIRWTFTVDPDRRAAVESHLADLGLDVQVRGEGRFIVIWDEPEGDIDGVVEDLWEINGAPFEVTHEEFHRTSLFVFHHDDSEGEEEADKAVA